MTATATVIARRRTRRRRALAHQCQECRQLWALFVVQGPGGRLILCRYCGSPRAVTTADRRTSTAVPER